jgi:uncharacterized delta-60 repeat protein
MPLLSTRGAASASGFGFLAKTGIGGPYWIGMITGGVAYGYGVAVDSSGNVYIVGYSNGTGAGNNDIVIAKYNISGAIQWQRSLGLVGNDYGYGIAVDSSGNVYVTGLASGGSNFTTVKYNTSGTIQWQRKLSSPNTGSGYGIAVDSSGNVYVTGYTSSGGSDVMTVKYDTNGNIQWQRIIGYSGNDESGYGVAVDPSGNVYVTGYTNGAGSGSYEALIVKYNSSGTIQWQRVLGSSTFDYGQGIAVDSSGNVYVAGYTLSNTSILIAKYDTNGTIQWQRSLRSGSGDRGFGITVDSSSNVYVTGYTFVSGIDDNVVIAKYDTNGTIQWQRTLGGASSDRGRSISVDISGNVYFAGWSGNPSGPSYNIFFAKLPGDGSKTGTYDVNGDSVTYAVSSLTSSTSTLTSATSTITNSTSTETDSAGTLTSSTSFLTSSVTTI